jgi:predicted ATPase
LEKIIIENFKAIEKADIEIKNFTVFIGEQASGKSTIAKLVYFFKTLPYQILDFIVNELPYSPFIDENISKKSWEKGINRKLRDYLRTITSIEGDMSNLHFSIAYTYPTNKKLTFAKEDDAVLKYNFQDFLEFASKEIDVFLDKTLRLQKEFPISVERFRSDIISQQEIREFAKPLTWLIEDFFWGEEIKNSLFVPASRNATVMLQDILSAKFIKEKSNRNYIRYYEANLYFIEQFIEYSAYLVNDFRVAGSFNGLANLTYFDNEYLLNKFIEKVEKVIKGKYGVNKQGEFILYGKNGLAKFNNSSIDFQLEYLVNASSGQQEVIRLFQDLFVLLVKNTNAFRVYEEPEAHLFPAAQQKIVETIAMLINHNPAHQFLITTHSPYFIAAIDVLLEANEAYQQRTEGKNIAQKQAIENEIAAIVPRSEWVDFEKVVVYSLEQNPETGKYIAKTAMRENRGVKAEIIDKVSEDIDSTYSQLLDIHYHEDGNE